MGFVAMQDMTGCELTFDFLKETDRGSGTEAMRLQNGALTSGHLLWAISFASYRGNAALVD